MTDEKLLQYLDDLDQLRRESMGYEEDVLYYGWDEEEEDEPEPENEWPEEDYYDWPDNEPWTDGWEA